MTSLLYLQEPPVVFQSNIGAKIAIIGFLMFSASYWLDLAELSSNMARSQL